MKLEFDKYTWWTLLLWVIWSVLFAGAEYVSFYMPFEGELEYWRIWVLETIWLVLGAAMMLITMYQYKHHPSKVYMRIKNKITKKK